jgi:hypothetical protein
MKKSKNKAPCIQEAIEIQKKRGGDLYILGKFPSQGFWHIVVKKNDKYYDVKGAKTELQIKKKYPSSPLRKATKKDKEYLMKINNGKEK